MGMRYGGKPRGYRFGPRFGKLAVEDFQASIERYFDECSEDGEIPTLSGLAASTGVATRTMEMWQKEKSDIPEFQPFIELVNQAKMWIEADLIQCMLQGQHAAAGAFSLVLRNHHGFQEKTEQVIEANVGYRQVVINGIDPDA